VGGDAQTDVGRPILHRDREGESAEVQGALDWVQVRALVADGISERAIARRLGMNRRTVARLARSEVPPRYRLPPTESKLDPFEPVLGRLLVEWPQIKAPRATELLRDEYG
jgi:transposase